MQTHVCALEMFEWKLVIEGKLINYHNRDLEFVCKVDKWVSQCKARKDLLTIFSGAKLLRSPLIVGQLRPSIVHKMLKLWDFALSFIKAKATFFWYATYCGISKMAAIDLESSTWVKNWNILRFFWK